MKKVAIITIWDLWNLGNRLQNYAVTLIANKKGLSPITVVKEKPIRDGLFEYIKYVIYGSLFLFSRGTNKKSRSWLRVRQFIQFTKKYIPYKRISDYKDLNNYDYVMIGSDQIWNAEIVEPNEFVYGQVEDKDKIICMAPSFGVSGFNASVEQTIGKYINNIKYINVREHAGANIIKRVSGIEAPVFVDPTLMLSSEEWEKLEKRPFGLKKGKYILKYFLGEETEECKKETRILTEKYGFEVIKLLDISNPFAYIVGPGQFLYLIHHAEIILTDSFHACVFSALFKKPFWVYSRVGERMNSRLDTLFDLLQVDNRFEHDIENPYKIDYSRLDINLECERKKFENFIDKAIIRGDL